MNYDARYPSVQDLKMRAMKRIPKFAFDYVDGGIDEEYGKRKNRRAWHQIELIPRYLVDVSTVDQSIEIFDKKYSIPIGIPPIGLGNMMWPGAELALAKSAQQANIPYILSTFSTTYLEEIASVAPDTCWFQLYVPKKVSVMQDLLKKVKVAGYHALVVTLDIPVGAKRNRELKNNLKLPLSLTPEIIWQCITHPIWTFDTVRYGYPDFVNVIQYREGDKQGLGQFITDFNMHGVTRERIEMIRKLWDGPLILKGLQYEKNLETAKKIGVDGVIVSNHGGRQIDGAPSSVESLQQLIDRSDNMTMMIDSGIRTGIDVVRARALGAEMTFSGRSFFWGVGALGRQGGGQVIEIFRDEIDRTLKQLGCVSYKEMDGSWLS